MGLCSWNSLVLLCSSAFWSSCFIEYWNGLLKIQRQHQLRGNAFQDWSIFLQEAACAVNLHLVYGAASLIARIHRPRNQGVKIRKSRDENDSTHSYSWGTTVRGFAFHPHELLHCWSRSLHSKVRSVSIRRHHNDSIDLEVEAVIWPL